MSLLSFSIFAPDLPRRLPTQLTNQHLISPVLERFIIDALCDMMRFRIKSDKAAAALGRAAGKRNLLDCAFILSPQPSSQRLPAPNRRVLGPAGVDERVEDDGLVCVCEGGGGRRTTAITSPSERERSERKTEREIERDRDR